MFRTYHFVRGTVFWENKLNFGCDERASEDLCTSIFRTLMYNLDHERTWLETPGCGSMRLNTFYREGPLFKTVSFISDVNKFRRVKNPYFFPKRYFFKL